MRLKGTVVAALLFASRPAVAIEGGVEDRVTTHAVAIATGGPSSPALRCSGTLVASNVVLTVRHCLTPLPSGFDSCEQTFAATVASPGDYWVNATPWVDPSSSWKKTASWVLPEPSTVCGNDVALLVLESPFHEAEATPARPVMDPTELERVLSARTFGMAAFGASSADGAGAGRRRRRLDIPIECVPGDPAFACADALDLVDPTELTGGAGPCTGDSGGGAFASTDHGLVFGVLSRGDVAAGTCARGVYERTDIWGWLIAKTVLDATPSGTAPPSWARDAFPDAPRVGDRCRAEGTCVGDAACVSFDARRSFVCAARCSAGCAEGTHCEGGVCTPNRGADAGEPKASCSAAPSARSSPLVLLAVALLARRRMFHRPR